jgi:5'-nucleotidase
MDASIPEAPDVKAGVEAREFDLEHDPFFAPKFVKLGSSAVELSDANLNTGESLIGDFVMDLFRQKAGAHLAISTSSSFRASIPPGDITVESYQAALPFRNIITNVDLPGSVVRELLNYGASKVTTDSFLQQSGARFAIRNGQAQDIQILVDPADMSKGYAPLDDAKTYTVSTTDFAANVQADLSKIFGKGTNKRSTGFVVNDVVIDYIKNNSPVSAKLDGRITTGAVTTPATASAPAAPSASAPSNGGTYTVQPGDTLSGIAARVYGDANRWPAIYDANRSVIGANPSLIVPGQVLKLP